MNSWLDRGLFTMSWVGIMWAFDALTTKTGIQTYGSLMIGAVSITAIGFVIHYYDVIKKGLD